MKTADSFRALSLIAMIEHKVIRMRIPEKSSCVCLELNEKRYGNQKVIIFIIFFGRYFFREDIAHLVNFQDNSKLSVSFHQIPG